MSRLWSDLDNARRGQAVTTAMRLKNDKRLRYESVLAFRRDDKPPLLTGADAALS